MSWNNRNKICLEKIACKPGSIDVAQVEAIASGLKQDEHGKYLLKMLSNEVY